MEEILEQQEKEIVASKSQTELSKSIVKNQELKNPYQEHDRSYKQVSG